MLGTVASTWEDIDSDAYETLRSKWEREIKTNYKATCSWNIKYMVRLISFGVELLLYNVLLLSVKHSAQ